MLLQLSILNKINWLLNQITNDINIDNSRCHQIHYIDITTCPDIIEHHITDYINKVDHIELENTDQLDMINNTASAPDIELLNHYNNQ